MAFASTLSGERLYKKMKRQRRWLGIEPLEPRQLLAALAYDLAAQTALRNQLLNGVAQIADQGTEGTVAVFGDHATSVLESTDLKTVVAAADNGVSRIIAAGKTGFADFANATQFDTTAFYLNSLNWLSKGLGTAARIVTDKSVTQTWLVGQGFTNVTLRSDWQNGLGTADVLVTWFGNPTAAQQTATNNFLAAGKGMFVAYNGWAYSGGVTPKNSGGNALLRQYGLSWTDDSISSTFTGTIVLGTEAGNAVLASAIEASPASYSTNQQKESALAIKATFENVLASDPQLVAIRQAVLTNASTVIPTPSTPVSNASELIRLKIESAVLTNLLPTELFVHRTAASYGVIPAGTPRVTKALTYTTSASNTQTQWLSTGLYAAPGDVLTLTVPSGLVNQGWSWKIGSHDDDISAKTTYQRMPSGVSFDQPIDATSIQVGSVYGGMIYLVKPTTSATATGSYNVSISNAVEAPTFVLGQTTDANWIATIRNLPAPYAELIASNVIIILHSDDIRLLSNPTAVMTYWQDRMAAQDDLTNSPVPRTRPERIDDDLDISAGFMHSGYPVAAYGHNLANMVDSDPGDDWGFVHEFGHNHQSSLWTFNTEGEVTVNIMSMRAFDSAGTIPTDSWRKMWSASGRAAYIPTFIAGGRLRTTDLAASLTTYAELREAFGWEPFGQFFRQYQTDLAANLPTTDQQERDQWVTRFSSIVGKNLGPFLNAWGFAASATALNAVSSLPAWSYLEAATPNPTVNTPKNNTVTFDPRTGFVDIMSQTLAVTFNAAPTQGTLTPNANGTFTYTPPTNWTGHLAMPYTISNGQGGTSAGVVNLNVVPAILNRQVFYNNSGFDSVNSGTIIGDNNAIGSDKLALLPGQSATIANYTNFVRGITGLMIDIVGLAPRTLTTSDFQLSTWNGNSAAGFRPTSVIPTISTVVGGGQSSSDRVKLIFPDSSLKDTWLRITVLANANTGLSANDVFYFGNKAGDMNVGNIGSPITIRVDDSDSTAVRQNQSPTANSVGPTNLYDVNKDGRVNALDLSLVRQNASTSPIYLFTAPISLHLSVMPTSQRYLGLSVPAVASGSLSSLMSLFSPSIAFDPIPVETSMSAAKLAVPRSASSESKVDRLFADRDQLNAILAPVDNLSFGTSRLLMFGGMRQSKVLCWMPTSSPAS